MPPVVKNILIINIILFIATISLSKSMRIDLTDILGLHYFGASKFQPYQAITYMFMHGGLSHIFFNMFAVWMFGNALESVWGPKRFLLFYLITGVGAAITHYIIMYFFEISPVLEQINLFLANPSLTGFTDFVNSAHFSAVSVEVQNRFNELLPQYNYQLQSDPDKALQSAIDFMLFYRAEFLNAPVVIGASGAVFGILLAFGMMFPNSLIYLYFAIPIKAKWFVMIYGAIELYAGITNKGSNVAHFAHLGGMLFGFILIWYWRKRTRYFQ
ncbi:MAG: rhomboid family intramembrane serine protease [Bacteroidales bacterium]